MCEDNQTEVREFVLLGFGHLHKLKILLFTLFLVIYSVILGGNLLIVLLVTTTDQLNVPMFYFLKHLALSDIVLTTDIIPLMLDVTIKEQRAISRVGCITQLYIGAVSSYVQCFLLAVMSYDRLLAICNPLKYTLIMSPNVCLQLVAGLWLSFLTLISSEMILCYQLQFCGQSYIDHFFCEFVPLLNLTVSDASVLRMLDAFFSIPLIFFPFVFIVITYVLIFFSIMKITSLTGRSKFFSTCFSHLISVCTYYVTLVVVYIIPYGEDAFDLNKFRSLLYMAVTPLMNPIIYSLRNTEIRRAIQKLFMFNSVTY
ncbi:olfactory receptor 5P66-like [Pelobates fuscus]|uniref:olfactory receptor 5P66-like n=1 Tax=Pelobates fuscus TaxID=191477 RepID=UPI002FE443F3